MAAVPLTLRIFLSSPGDVAEERRLAQKIVEQLEAGHLLRDVVHFELVAWDDVDASVPIDAGDTPQVSIVHYSQRPADCDLTLVILWARIGTPLPSDMTRSDGTRYESGTVWEYEDARAAGKPVYIYRRKTKPLIEVDDPHLDAKRAQYEAVNAFFAPFTNKDGSIEVGVNDYTSVEQFGSLLRQHLEAFVKIQLKAKPSIDLVDQQGFRKPFLAPDLPGGFVPRPREYEPLLARVLSRDQAHPATMTTRLQGSGGYGKTTLAIALCHDRQVIAAFEDGVLWTSLGQTPRLLDELAKWYEALTGRRPAFIDVPQATTQLAEQLEGRRCLLVLDDAWDRSHVEPFLRGGSSCARVLTTRRLDLLSEAPRVRVDEMDPAEARQVLASAFPEGVVPEGRLTALAGRLGKWPLLLKLAAGMVQKRLNRDDSSDGALAFVESLLEKSGVVAFDAGNAVLREDAVNKTISASREQLDDRADDRRFLDLGIFPEAIPLTTLERLWGLDDTRTALCAQKLDDVALVSLDLRRGVVTLHDVMGAYLRQQPGDLATVHAQLVTGYGDPLRLPDAYAWRRLPYHLQQAGQLETLRDLLLNPTWLQAQLRAVGAYDQLRAFAWAGHDGVLPPIRGALRLALPALVADPSQLCEQLLGRLPEGASVELDAFRLQLRHIAPAHGFHARRPNLVGTGSLVQTLPGKGPVQSASALPDGRVLSWSGDGTLRVWDLATGEGRALSGREGSVRSALVLPDGRVLSWSGDGTLRVWDLATGEGRALIGHEGGVTGALVLPDGGVLSWSGDGTLRVWDLATGEGRALIGHEGGVTGALVLPDGGVLSWSRDGTLRVWDLETGERHMLTGQDDGVWGAMLLPDERVLSWSGKGTLRVWDVATGETRTLTGHDSWVTGALVLPDGAVLSWSRDGTLRVWDLATGEGRPLTGHDSWVTGALVLPDGRVLSWSQDETVRVWDVATGEGRALTGHDGWVTGALVLPDRRVLSWSSDSTLRVWDVATNEGRALIGHEDWVTGAMLLADGRVLSWSRDETLRVWDLATDEGRALTGHEDEVTGALMLPDRRVLSWSSGDWTLRIWDLATGQWRALTGHAGGVKGALVLPSGRVLSWSADTRLRVWDLPTDESHALSGHDSWVEGALMLPDGRVLSWSGDRTLRVWDLATGEGRVLSGHDSWVEGALVLPDGRVLSWSGDRTLRVWDLATGEGRALVGHEAGVQGALVLPDGRVLSWSGDGTLRVWDLATGEGPVLVGHEEWVTGALVLPDGGVLSWSGDGTLRVWDPATGEGRALTGHEGGVRGALVLPDGRVLSWGWDGTLRVWTVATGVGRAFTGHEGGVRGARVLPDGGVLSWSRDRTLRRRDIDREDEGDAFYFDAEPTVVLSVGDGQFFVGDALGRIHVLEWLSRALS